MGSSCSIYPSIRKANGSVVRSQLGMDLIGATQSVSKGWDIYRKSKNDTVQKRIASDMSSEYDVNGEPTLLTLMDHVDIGSQITQESIAVNETIKVREMAGKSIESKYEAARQYNETSPYKRDYVAVVEREGGKEVVNVHYRHQGEAVAQSKRSLASKSLNDKLRVLLNNTGVSVGVLDDAERRLGVNGVTDFEGMKRLANGMIELIRVSNDLDGEAALPEEFAHAAIAMLENDPLVKRLVASVSNEAAMRQILGAEYEEYLAKYDGDMNLMAEEAAGKLLAEALKGNDMLGQKQPRSLIERVWKVIKEFVKRTFKVRDYVDALESAREQAGELSSAILSGEKELRLNPETMRRRKKMYQLTQEAVDEFNEVSEKITKTLLKRAEIAKRIFDTNVMFTMKKQLANLEATRFMDNSLVGIIAFMKWQYKELENVNALLCDEKQMDAMTTEERAETLRQMKLILDSISVLEPYFADVLATVNDMSEADKKKFLQDNKDLNFKDLYKDLKNLHGNMVGVRSLLDANYRKESETVFKQTMDRYLQGGKELIVDGKKVMVTADNIMEMAKGDVNFLSRWLDSANDTNNIILNIFDQLVKQKRADARNYMLEKYKEIQAIGIAAEREGLTNFDFMYQVDDEGKRTGFYNTEVDYAKFHKDSDAKKAEAEKLYPKDLKKQRKHYSDWYRSVTKKAGEGRVVDLSKAPQYRNAAWLRMTDVQRKYFDRLMAIKKEFDDMLPENTFRNATTIKIQKDNLERIMASKSFSDVKEFFKNFAKDRLLVRSQDTEYGSDEILLDFDGTRVNTVRTRYLHLGSEDSEEDVTKDMIGSLIAYGAMACEFYSINDIVNEMENARDYVKLSHHPQMTRGEKLLNEKFRNNGREYTDEAVKDVSRLTERLDDFMEMQVYGNMHKDEGTLGKTNISKGKLADTVNWYTSLCTYAVNLLSGISNIATGVAMMNIEAFCQEHFKAGDLMKADAIYAAEMPSYMSELGSRVRDSKLRLFGEMFNVSQDYEGEMKSKDFDRKNWLTNLFKNNPLFLLNTCGEHWMAHRTALALANSIKLKKGSEVVSLWDALEVVERDGMRRLVVSEGVTNLDGNAFTQDDIDKIGRKIKWINESMHGIYNEEDRNAIQQYGLGRMAIMFRKWIVPSLKRRFGSRKINMDLGMEQEGYYRTVWNFAVACAHDIKNGSFSVAANWEKLSDHQKRNFARAAIEVVQYTLIVAAIGLLGGAGDDKKGSWWYQMARYQLFRLKTELGVLIPLPTTMPFEAFRILKSPAAAVQTGQHVFELVKLLNPFNYEMVGGEDAVIRSGGYKGWSKAEKYAAQSLPLFGPLHNATNVEDMVQFFSNQ